MLTHLSLFSGIGGINLACDWAGFETILNCEIDSFCRKVLRKHWPSIPILEDIHDVTKEQFTEPITLLTGGFPCQDLSTAGRKTGINGQRSGLWWEMSRVIDATGPTWCVIENIHQGWRSWVPIVRGDLWTIGYSSVPIQVSAYQVGAAHRRSRCFVVANTNSDKLWLLPGWCRGQSGEEAVQFAEPWDSAPRRLGAYDGVPSRVDRLRALGNAVVPQQIYPILKAIADIENCVT